MTQDELSDFADALRRRRAADDDLSRILGLPVERWNLCELVTARALDVEVELSSVEWGQVGVFRSGPLAGSRVSVRFYSAMEPLRPTAPEPPCDHHVAILGPPDTRFPELIHGIYLFEVAWIFEEMERSGGLMAQVDEAWDAFKVFPGSFSPWKVIQSEARGLLYQVQDHAVRSAPPRHSADPENRYPGRSLLPFEKLAEKLVQSLAPPPRVTRARDAVQLEWKDERGTVVLITPEEIQTRIPRVEWLGPHEARSTSRLDSTMKVSQAQSREGFLEVLGRIRASVRKRLSLYRTCRLCGERFPPEYGCTRDTCDSCARKHLGVIH